MIKKFALSTTLLFAGLDLALSQVPAPIRAAPQLEVITTDGAGNEKHLSSINGMVPMVMVRPNQAVPITLQFPNDNAGTPVAATPLDGGRINRSDLVVLPTGKVIFTFKPGAAPGRYRLWVQTPSGQHVLSFYVVDPANPPFKPRTPR